METDYSFSFHQFSKDRSLGHVPISDDVNQWPREWLTTYYKVYPRLPKIQLDFERTDESLFAVIERRVSKDVFDTGGLTKKELGTLLRYGYGNIRPSIDGKRMLRSVPSAGTRFPLEVYVFVLQENEDGIRPGIYHYNIRSHALDVLPTGNFSQETASQYFAQDWVKKSGVIVVMTAVFERTQSKYGERGYRYILIEAGHVGQNFSLVSEALKLGACPLGGVDDQKIEGLLGIDGIRESVVYAMAIGRNKSRV